MRILIAYSSVHHRNTEKVARAMAEASGGELLDLVRGDGRIPDPAEYDLIGFGSGIYGGKVHKSMKKFLEDLPAGSTKAFVFSTSSLEKPRYNGQVEKILVEKGYILFNGFSCKGWDSFGPLKLVGGISKSNPDSEDLRAAKEHICRIKEEMEK